MSSDIVFSAVKSWFTANWSTMPVYYENEADPPPADLSPWAYVEIIDNGYAPGSIGAGATSAERWVERGYVLAHIFVVAGKGSLVARSYATQLANLLRGLELSPSIRFRDLSIGTGATADNGNWWGITVRADWIRN